MAGDVFVEVGEVDRLRGLDKPTAPSAVENVERNLCKS